MTEQEQVSTLSEQDRLRLWRLLGKLPAIWHVQPRPWETMTVDDLVTALERIVEGTAGHFAECQRRDTELAAHRALIEGGRRLVEAFVPGLAKLATLGQGDDDCTHGDGCPVHPDVHQVHNFDGVFLGPGYRSPDPPETTADQWATEGTEYPARKS